MVRRYDRKIVLEGGEEYLGYGFGDMGDGVFEIVFNTCMVGYQEIICDPSYAYQMVVMTYPLIGNSGITDEDFEMRMRTPNLGALVVREINTNVNHSGFTKTLSEVLEEAHIPGISGVDTRMLTRSIRDRGSRRAMITDVDTPIERALEIIASTEIKKDAVRTVSCKKRWYARTSRHKWNLVAIDCGIKAGIIRDFNEKGCNVAVVPYDTTAEEILAMKPDGVFISDGPGDPEDIPETAKTVCALKGRLPMFGIGLGHQLLALACGAKTVKMKFGHRGANQPIRDLETGKIEIVNQNHGYAVDIDSLKGTALTPVQVNVMDGTLESMESKSEKLFSIQYMPDGCMDRIFDSFIRMIKEEK